MTSAASFLKQQVSEDAVVRAYGRGRHVELELDPDLPLPMMEQALRDYLARSHKALKNGKIALNLGPRVLNLQEVNHLRKIVEEDFKLSVAGLWCGSDTLAALMSDRPPLSMPEHRRGKPAEKHGWQETLLVRGTCRSGTTIYNNGNVVVLGDVNPGAEVAAGKDIIIFGKLRGVAHAGVKGADDAVIVALSIAASQLRIGRYIGAGASGTAHRRGPSAPEIAVVEDGHIVVQPYTAMFK